MRSDEPDYRSDDDLDRYRYSRSPEENLSSVVTRGIIDILECDIEELPPLSETLDVDALDALFVSRQADVRLEFDYSGCHVTVEGETEVCISPPEE